MNQLRTTRGFDPIDDLFRGFFVRPVDFNLDESRQNNWQLKVDIAEKDTEFVISADLPGIKKEDINVHIEGNIVSVSAETKRNTETNEGKFLRQERYYGKTSRSFQLPQDVDEEKADAKFSDGVLILSLPKKQTSISKKLEIK